MNSVINHQPATTGIIELETLKLFIEDEADLLDQQRFEEWYQLFTDDGIYWAPAKHGQESGVNHVSLFYDEKHTLKTRITRLEHPMIHCQEPASHCVRLVSSIRLESVWDDGNSYKLSSKFIMIEDRVGSPRRLSGGRCLHVLRREHGVLRIVQKRVELTNCDQSFPMLTQPF